MSTSAYEADPEVNRRAVEATLSWHGWGSPVGLAIGLIGLGIAGVLARLAVLGW